MDFLRLTSIMFFRIFIGSTGNPFCLAFGIIDQNLTDNLKEIL